ncbi:hypothetical protein DPMN_128263 [Dreissena polymorpha]|uniref:Uncharacterized protein n=1 Tax=Dreissena polymorpha TaxID=45954 RepID=A0A9D4H3J1_DREPO|nr:hypothetical protein DPMN_128263 [Dreissena polymorpha]
MEFDNGLRHPFVHLKPKWRLLLSHIVFKGEYGVFGPRKAVSHIWSINVQLFANVKVSRVSANVELVGDNNYDDCGGVDEDDDAAADDDDDYYDDVTTAAADDDDDDYYDYDDDKICDGGDGDDHACGDDGDYCDGNDDDFDGGEDENNVGDGYDVI